MSDEYKKLEQYWSKFILNRIKIKTKKRLKKVKKIYTKDAWELFRKRRMGTSLEKNI